MLISVLLVLAGAALLLIGGELLVRGAASLARSLGISGMVVGLTVVAFGTSAPEFVVSVLAAVRGNTAICAGNIVGSNILNILVVLGATALICPIKASASFVRREVPVMAGVSLLVWYFAGNGNLSSTEAAILLALLAAYTVFVVWIARQERKSVRQKFDAEHPYSKRSLLIEAVMVVAGLSLLTGGSEVFLRGAVDVAQRLGISETLIGLTLVALGTSLPELAASLIAAYRKHPDICLGNVVGSCIYNLLWIGGTAGLVGVTDGVRGLPFDVGMRSLHLPIMVFSAVVMWPIIVAGLQVSRRSGVFLLFVYAAYATWIIWTRV